MQPDEMQDELRGGEGAMTPLHPSQVHVLRIRTFVVAAAATLAIWVLDLALGQELRLPPLVVPGAVLLLALLLVIVFPARRYRRWGYREGEDEIEIRRGNVVRVRTIVPFGRVQHIDVAQGPIQRAFGLATLILHTAGTHGASVPLPGLTHGDAEAMRDRIRAKIRQEFA